LSVEGGMKGNQQRLVCPNCGKVFFAWRPDEHPAVKIKCYFCRHEFADAAALREFLPPPGEPAQSVAEGGGQREGAAPPTADEPKPSA
jgi:hypothetical protein